MAAHTLLAQKVKFATQADPLVLEALRALAASEGRHIQALLDEALREYLVRRQDAKPRPEVLSALDNSMRRYDDLYKKLAK